MPACATLPRFLRCPVPPKPNSTHRSYDAASHAKAHVLLTKRADPGSAAAAAAAAAASGGASAVDAAAAVAAASATVPGGPGRWMLPPADEGAGRKRLGAENSACCCV